MKKLTLTVQLGDDISSVSVDVAEDVVKLSREHYSFLSRTLASQILSTTATDLKEQLSGHDRVMSEKFSKVSEGFSKVSEESARTNEAVHNAYLNYSAKISEVINLVASLAKDHEEAAQQSEEILRRFKLIPANDNTNIS